MDIDQLENMNGQAGVVGQTQQNASHAAQLFLDEKEKGLVDITLEVDTIKTEIYHLIKQDKLKVEDDSFVWKPLVDQKKRILSDEGVDRIMQIIHFYVNKNTLLSNFSEDQINRLMLRFVTELNDLILLKYQVIFYNLSFEECKVIIKERIDDRKKMKMFSLEILGKEIDEKEIGDKLLKEIEDNLEREMTKVREEQRKEKLRDYGLIMAQLETMVFATLNRAWKGEERGSIRRHTTISELVGNTPKSQDKGGIFSWGRK